jgi:hypothetical protein
VSAEAPPHVPPLSLREGAPHAAPHHADETHPAEHPGSVSKEEMQRALEAVRAKRAGQPALQPKPQQKASAPLPAVDEPELEDIVEDEEVSAPPVKRQGFGPATDGCPPMKGLVQRRLAKQADGEGEPSTRKGALQDGVF